MGRLTKHYDEIVRRYLANETATRIGQAYGTTYKGIWKILKKRGVKIRHAAKIFPTRKSEMRVVRQYESGLSLTQIAREHGCNFITVRNVLIKHGIQPRPRGATSRQFSVDERREIVEAYKAKQSQEAIG